MKPSLIRNSTIASACILSLLLIEGCGKNDGKGGVRSRAGIEAKLNAIRQAGEPVTLDEVNAMYAEPPTGQNAAPLYAEAFEVLTTDDARSPRFAAENSRAVGLLHHAATRRQCRYPIDLSMGFETPLPHLTKFKACANLLAMDAVSKATQGRADLAAQSVSAGLALSRSLEEEPTLVSQSVRASTIDIAFTGIEVSLNRRPFAETQLAALQVELADAAGRNGNSFKRAWLNERVTGLALFHSSEQLSKMVGILSQNRGAATVEWSRVKQHMNSPAFQDDEEAFLESLTRLIAIAEDTFPASLDAAKAVETHLEDAQKKNLIVSAMLLRDLTKVFENSANAESELRVAQTVMAVERFRIAHNGALPDSLQDMVPQFLKAVPLDPFDGSPLRFKKNSPRGYMVYSTGPDRQDDGGIPQPARASTGARYDVTISVSR